MNEVSFRDSILDSIDTIVTESSNDVLFSLLDTADKAMMIMENCTDTDDIWKYSIWQEADGNSEQIDKDKHPFKENSTLKTILMLPINLIKFIFKTISQAFSPQKAEESSKLAVAAEKGKSIAQKIVPFFFTSEGELNIPVTVVTGAAGGGLTIDAIIRKNHSIVVTVFNKIRDLFTRAIRALKQMRGEDVPEQFTFTPNKSDASKYDTCLDFEKAGTYLDEMGKLFEGLSAKIKEIKDAPDEKNKIAKSKELVSNIKKVTNLCPIYKSIKTYSTTEIAEFYKTASEKTQKFAKQEAVNTFINEYKTSITDNDKTKNVIANVSQALGRSFAVYNAFITAVQGINDINDAINKAIGEVVRQVDDPNNAQVTTGNEPPKADETNNQYEEVTDKSKAPDGFPTGYFTKDADGKYVAVANDATWDANTTYFKQKTDTAAATDDGSANATPTDDGTPPADDNVHEYAVDDDFDIVDTHYTAYVEFYDEETGDIVEEAFVDEDNDVCYVLEGGTYLGGSTVKRIYTPKSKFTVDVNDDPISIEDDKQLEEKLDSLDSAKDRTRTVKIKPTAKGLTVDYISTKVSNNKSVRIDTGHRLVITGAAAVKKSNIMRNKDNVEKTSKQGKTIRIGKLGEDQKKSLKTDRDKAVQESYDASIDATVSSWYNK